MQSTYSLRAAVRTPEQKAHQPQPQPHHLLFLFLFLRSPVQPDLTLHLPCFSKVDHQGEGNSRDFVSFPACFSFLSRSFSWLFLLSGEGRGFQEIVSGRKSVHFPVLVFLDFLPHGLIWSGLVWSGHGYDYEAGSWERRWCGCGCGWCAFCSGVLTAARRE